MSTSGFRWSSYLPGSSYCIGFADATVSFHDRDSASPSTRVQKLQFVGTLSGFAAGAWLGAAEAPTKLVTLGISPLNVSLLMVFGVFLARWSLPALIRGTSQIRTDVHNAPHLMVWGVLAGCLWAVANTLTIFAIRDIGLSIAFPLWNVNSLLGIFWGFLLFNELRDAGTLRWLTLLGGALLMFVGATLLAVASSTQSPADHPFQGVIAALGAGLLWGTMYIPYRKAYLTGMNPLSFVAFFTVGELAMMLALAFVYGGGLAALWRQLAQAREALFWLMLGGFVWVIGDLFQQYAAKYVGISRGIPLSNTNQLWGLLWGILVFGELRGLRSSLYAQVVGGSLLMAAGAAAIALSSVSSKERARWREAAERESRRYAVSSDFVNAALSGLNPTAATNISTSRPGRSFLDWLLILLATAAFLVLATLARAPNLAIHWSALVVLTAALLMLLVACGLALWRTTGFN